MLVVSLSSVAVSVAIVEMLLVEQQISRWYALSIGLFGGQVFSVAVVVAEPLALCLSLAAMVVFARGRWMWSAVLFALAGLTKETQLILAMGYFVYLMRTNRPWRALAMGAIVSLPVALWQTAIRVWLGAWGLGAGGAGATSFQIVPFGALFSLARIDWAAFVLFAIILIPIAVLPDVWAIVAAGRAIHARDNHPWIYAMLLYACVIPFLPASTALDLSAMPRFLSPLVALVVLFAAHCRAKRVLDTSLLWITTVALVPFF
jgi:hypothetical protein